MKTTKTTMFIVMVCLLLIGATTVTAQSMCSAVSFPKVEQIKTINVNGMKGDLSIMNSPTATTEPITTISETPSEARDVVCSTARRYMFNNAILENTDYNLNNDCQVVQKVEYKKSFPCGRMVNEYVNGIKTGNKVHRNICMKNEEKWVVVA